MEREYLKNRSGSNLGFIKNEGGKQTIFDQKGKRLGSYDEKTDTTFNRSGSRVAIGNFLSSLLGE